MDMKTKLLSRIELYKERMEEAEKQADYCKDSPVLKGYYQGKADATKYALFDLEMLLDLVGDTND